jgi:excisionase family DNA binding protein
MTSDQLPEHQGGHRRSVSGAWTMESVRSLGLTTTVDTAASILGISRTKAYALAKTGDFPTRLVRVGRRYLVPIPALLDLLTSDRDHMRGDVRSYPK